MGTPSTLSRSSRPRSTDSAPDETAEIPLERRARQGEYRADLNLVFCKPDGNPHDPDETTRRFERRTVRCPGVRFIHFHGMRHAHATLLLVAGENVEYVAERLGDREDTVVETYAHVTPRMRSSAVGKVRAFLGLDPGARDAAVVRPTVGIDAEFGESIGSAPGPYQPSQTGARA